MSKISWAAKVASAAPAPPSPANIDSDTPKAKDLTATKQQSTSTKQPPKPLATAPSPTSSNNSAATSTQSSISSSSASSPAMSPASVSASRNLLNYFLTHLRGHLVLLQLRDATVHEGIFHTADVQTSPDRSTPDTVTLVIKQVQQQADSFAAQHATSPRLQHTVASAERNTAPVIPQRKFALSDIVQMRAAALDVNDTTEGSNKLTSAKKGISTDREISNRDFQERELTRWDASGDAAGLGGGGGLDEDAAANGALSAAGGRGWDQFTAHERMTGKQSTFNMDDYTTPLDKQSAHYREHSARAERIAREIERQGSAGNLHLAMERGQVREAEVDEEAQFSSVLDEGKAGGVARVEKAARVVVDGKADGKHTGAYVPPGKRREGGDTGGAVETKKAKDVESKEEEKKEKLEGSGGAGGEKKDDQKDKKERATEQKIADSETKAVPKVVEKEKEKVKAKAEEKNKEKVVSKAEDKKSATPAATKQATDSSKPSQLITDTTPATGADSAPLPIKSASAPVSADTASTSSPSSSSSITTDSSTAATAPATATATADKPKSKLKLNPNAKSFSLSATAKEFVPSFAATGPLSAATPPIPTAGPPLPLTQLPQPQLPMFGQQLPAGMQPPPQMAGYGGLGMGMALMHPGGMGAPMQFNGALGAGAPRLMNGGMLPPGAVPMVGGQPMQPAAYFAQQPFAMAPMQPQLLQPGLFPPQQPYGSFVPHPSSPGLSLAGGAGRGGLSAVQQQQLTQHLMMAAAAQQQQQHQQQQHQQQQQQQQQQMHDPRFFNPAWH